jgi:hypothetical protein
MSATWSTAALRTGTVPLLTGDGTDACFPCILHPARPQFVPERLQPHTLLGKPGKNGLVPGVSRRQT